MNFHYSYLLNETNNIISEKKNSYLFLTERHIQAVWFEQKYFKNLVTPEGHAVEVLSPGIWNGEAGPDFLKAHLRVGDKEMRGDVEIHLVDEGWTQHRHQQDARYDQVVFHLSYWNPRTSKPIIKQNGEPVVQAYLEKHLTVPPTRLLQLIDLDLYPYKKFVGSGKCAKTLFNTQSKEHIQTLFEGAADWRLLKKNSFLCAQSDDLRTRILFGIASALGYKHNTEAFRSLFVILNDLKHLPAETLAALGCGIAGFFQEKYVIKWGKSSFYSHLKVLFFDYTEQHQDVDYKVPMITNQVRPLNHPIRRLAYLVKLIKSSDASQLNELVENLWGNAWPLLKTGKACRQFSGEMKALIPVFEDIYWNKYYTFEELPKDAYLTLMGEDVKTEILVNTFLPLLYAKIAERGRSEELKAFKRFYQIIPPAKTRKSQYLVHRFFGDMAKGSVMKKALMEQGAYQLHHDFCVHHEASCEGCPFVERYKALR